MRPSSSADMTVLIIESDVVLRNLILTVMVAYNYRVFEVNSAAEVLQLSEDMKDTVDLIVTGNSVDGRTGKQVAEQLRTSWPVVKILQMLDHPLEVVERQGHLIPGAELLVKPFLLADFEQKLKLIVAEMNRPSSTATI